MPLTRGKGGKSRDRLEVPADFHPVAAAFSRNRRVALDKGWGAGSFVLKYSGKIFVMWMKGNLIAKLPASRVDELVRHGSGVRFDPRGDGREMKEWVVLPEGGPGWLGLAREAHGFAVGAAGTRAGLRRRTKK